jgi:hypothetical protein
MPYQDLGNRQVVAAMDTTGLNTGNYTALFNPATYGQLTPSGDTLEVYHIFIATQPLPGIINWVTPGNYGQFMIWKNNVPWDNQPFSVNNAWDPSQPLLMRDSDEIEIFFSIAATVSPAPTVILWLRESTP